MPYAGQTAFVVPRCDSSEITQQGRDDTQPERQRYLCKSCRRHFDDLN